MDARVVVQRGRLCPDCKVVTEVATDRFCVCGYEFGPDHAEVGLNANGDVIESNGQAVAPSSSAPAAPAVAIPPAVTPAAAVISPSASPAVLTELRIRVSVDQSPRHGRPAVGSPDYADAPDAGPIEYVLSESLVPFGRAQTEEHDIVLEGDDAVSSFHGRLRRNHAGLWEVEHLSKSGPTVVRAENPASTADIRLTKPGQRHPLLVGEQVLVGDWIAITILEVNPL